MYKIYAITDMGKERTQNQDGFVIDGVHTKNVEHREIYYETDSDCVHVSICDGVGSTQYANFAVEKAQEFICNHLRLTNEQEIEKMVVDMNAFVYNSAKEEQKSDCACTVVGLIANGNSAYIYNIGDSPAFSINNGYLEKHSTEDIIIEVFGEKSLMVADDVQIKPPLLQSIGTNELIDKVHIKKISDSAAFLLCSDGITDMLSLDEMERILASSNSIKDIAQRYINESNRKGGYDNSTVILLVNEDD